MKNRKFVIVFLFSAALTFLIIVPGCGTGVDDSPDPGIVRITLQSDPSDTILVERSDTFSVSTKYDAVFVLKVFQGRVYRDTNFAVLYPSLTSYRQEDITYNIIEVDSSSNYKRFSVFESYVPPGDYTRLEFGISPSSDHNLKIVANSGKKFENPVELPPGEKLLVGFDQNFIVYSKKVTQIDVQVSPFRSIKRYRDIYIFYRIMKITGVEYFR